MFECLRARFVRLVTFEATHARGRVATVRPLLVDEGRSPLLMAADASLALVGEDGPLLRLSRARQRSNTCNIDQNDAKDISDRHAPLLLIEQLEPFVGRGPEVRAPMIPPTLSPWEADYS